MNGVSQKILVNIKLKIKYLVFFENRNIIGRKKGMYETRTPNKILMIIPSKILFNFDDLSKVLIK